MSLIHSFLYLISPDLHKVHNDVSYVNEYTCGAFDEACRILMLKRNTNLYNVHYGCRFVFAIFLFSTLFYSVLHPCSLRYVTLRF